MSVRHGVEYLLMPAVGAPVIARRIDAAAIGMTVESMLSSHPEQRLGKLLNALRADQTHERRRLEDRVVDRGHELVIDGLERQEAGREHLVPLEAIFDLRFGEVGADYVPDLAPVVGE